MSVYTIDVGFTTSRPIVPDEHFSRVQVEADTEAEATIIACCMVMRQAREIEEGPFYDKRKNRFGLWGQDVQMATSTEIVNVIL